VGGSCDERGLGAPQAAAVVAESRVLRSALAELLGADGYTVASVPDLAALYEHLDPVPACVVIAQASRIGPADVEKLRMAFPAAKVVVVADSISRRNVVDWLKAGVDGIVPAAEAHERLTATVRTALAGQLSIPEEYRHALAKPQLSPREKQVLGMVVLGLMNREIANRLFVAESTVKTHLASAFRKLGVRSRGEATALILDPEEGLGTGILSILDHDDPLSDHDLVAGEIASAR
jgi:DNA-binding NarL/FixJ family response regulator